MRKRVPGATLAAARAARGLAQEDVARLLDVRGPTISERETSDDVSWETWIALAHVLSLPDDWKPGDPVPPLVE